MKYEISIVIARSTIANDAPYPRLGSEN